MIHAGGQRFFILTDDEVQPPFPSEPVAIFDHGRNLITGIYMKKRKGNMSEERLLLAIPSSTID